PRPRARLPGGGRRATLPLPVRPQLLHLRPGGARAPRRGPGQLAHPPAPRPLPPLGRHGLGSRPCPNGELMFDGLFEVIAKVLSTFYDLTGDYALSIALLTLVVMVLTTPFTLKGTRSMIQMQRLQPEMRRLQLKYKDDRQKLNE